MNHKFLGIFLLFPSLVLASNTKIKVKKIKGPMALVQITGSVTEGETYSLVSNSKKSDSSEPGPRDRRMGISMNFTSLKTTGTAISYNPSHFNLNFDYGWNLGHHEGGPVFGYENQNTGFGGSTSTITIGGFYDYNYTENKVDTDYLFGNGIKITYASITPPGSTSLSQVTIYPHFFWKWFAFGNTAAIRADLGYYYKNEKVSASSEETSTGLKTSGALIIYF